MITKEQIINYLIKIKPSLNEKHHISKIGLFGSFATGMNAKDSDIDIIIEFETDDVDVALTKEYIRILIEKKFQKHVDIATEKYLFPLFKERILKNAIYV